MSMLLVEGKEFEFDNDTVFTVQVGKGPKGGYKTRLTFNGNMKEACRAYSQIDVGTEYKKRLVSSAHGVVAKAAGFKQ